MAVPGLSNERNILSLVRCERVTFDKRAEIGKAEKEGRACKITIRESMYGVVIMTIGKGWICDWVYMIQKTVDTSNACSISHHAHDDMPALDPCLHFPLVE